jgi:dihydroorotase
LKARLIKGGRVIDPGRGIDGILDILVADGKIAKVGRRISLRDAEVMNAAGLVAAPGFIDMHVHLREPGMEYKETIESGTQAAVAGGFTAVCCMPNTNPVNDDPSITRFILEQAARVGAARVFPVGAVSKGLKGEKLAEFGLMREAGIVAVSDDGNPVQSSELMRRALEYSRMFDMPVIDHCEDRTLAPGWIVHEGWISTKLGLRGIPAAGEIIPIQRDIALLKLVGGRLHIAHVSTEGGVEAIRRAKRSGLPVTAEATPHHFTLSEQAVEAFDTHAKMSPPLRTERDVEAIVEGVRDGTIDVIASDHAPHHEDEKNQEFDVAPFGVIGLETTLSVSLDRLVRKSGIDLKRVIEMFTVNPAAILGLPKRTLEPGADADITIFHPTKKVTIDVNKFRSRSRNCPFHGMTLEGSPAVTIVGGVIRYRKEKP